MSKTGIDQDALIEMFAQAGARQGEALRKAVSDAMLQALQGRELTLRNMKSAVKAVTEAASMGAAQNKLPVADVEKLLEKAFAGMDAALLKAVEANRRALSQLVDQGVAAGAKPVQAAVDQLEKLEDMFFQAVAKAAEGAGGSAAAPWQHVLEKMQLQGTQVGAGAASVAQMIEQAQGAMKASRASSMKATQALLDSYSALVSGVLIGMSDALRAGTASAAGDEDGGSDDDDAAPAAKKRARR